MPLQKKRTLDIATLKADAAAARDAVKKGSKPMTAGALAMLVGQPVFYASEAAVCCMTAVILDARPEHLSVTIGSRVVSRDVLSLDAYLILTDDEGEYAGLAALVAPPPGEAG